MPSSAGEIQCSPPFCSAYIRDRCLQQVGNGPVNVASYPMDKVWPDGKWGPRHKVQDLVGVEQPRGWKPVEVIGYADDTTIARRLSNVNAKRKEVEKG